MAHALAKATRDAGPSASLCNTWMCEFLHPLGPAPAAGRILLTCALACLGEILTLVVLEDFQIASNSPRNSDSSSSLRYSVLYSAAINSSARCPGGTGGDPVRILTAPFREPVLARTVADWANAAGMGSLSYSVARALYASLLGLSKRASSIS